MSTLYAAMDQPPSSTLWRFCCYYDILPLRIETGRFRNLPVEQRICELCELDMVEDEVHFLCTCSVCSHGPRPSCLIWLKMKCTSSVLALYAATDHGPPAAFPDSVVTWTGTSVGARATYHCVPGTAGPDTSVTCGPQGWATPATACTGQ